MRRALRLLLAHRRRLAPFVLLAGLLVVGGTVFDASPRETRIRFELGEGHADVTSARIVYLLDGDEVKGVRFSFAAGAPESWRHDVELSPGRYEVRVELDEGGRRRTLSRALVVPADGVVRIPLAGAVASLEAGGR